MEKVDKDATEIMNPEAYSEKSDKEVTADDVDKQLRSNSNVDLVKKKRRSENTSRRSESRNARRSRRSDADSSGTAAPAPRRSSPRVTEKSPAGGTQKADKEKSKSHSSAKPPKISKDINIVDPSSENLSHKKSAKVRPSHSSKSTTAKAKDNSTTHRKSRSAKSKPKIEISPPRQMETIESNLAAMMESVSLPSDGDSNEAKTIDIKQNSEKDIDTPTSSDTHIRIDGKTIESSREAALTQTLSDLELLTTLDLNENSTYSEQQPNIPDTPSIPSINTTEDQNDLYKSLDLDIVVNKQENLCEESVVAKQRAAVPRGLRDLLQAAGTERQHERAGSRARSTRSRVGTPIPPKSRKTRIKETKSSETPKKEQTNDKPETKSDNTATCSELPIEKQENEIPNLNISETSQNINDDAVEKAVATDQSEHPTVCNDIRYAIEKGNQACDQSTPSTCSSNSSCRKLRILIKKPVPRSKINFGQLENVEHADDELEDPTYPSDQSVCHDVGDKATEREPLKSLPEKITGEDQLNLNDQAENSTQITVDQQKDPAAADTKISEEDSVPRDAKDKLTDQEAASMKQQHNEKDDAVEGEKIVAEERQLDMAISQQPEQEASSQLATPNEQQHQPSEQTASEPMEQSADEQQQATVNIDQLCATETTGVMEHVDEEECTDTGSSNQMDASEPDAAKRKQMLQAKHASRSIAMAPPALPKSDLSSGNGVVRRLGRPIKVGDQPKQKRRKLAVMQSSLEDNSKSQLDTQESLSSTNEAMEEPGGKASGKHMLAVNMRSPIKPSTPGVSHLGKTLTATKLSKNDEVNKTPPIKSSLSTLLSDDDSMSINNTVIITKTAITNTTEPFKKVETPASPAVGINISVSLLPDPNSQTSSPPKKTMTQAETAKKLMSLSAAAKKEESSPIAKQSVASPITPNLPVQSAEAGKKMKARKSETDKRTPKTPLSRIAGKATSSAAKKSPKPTEEASEMAKAKEPTKPAAIVSPIVNRKSLPQTHAKKLDTHTNEISAAPVEAAGTSESNEASESVAAEELVEAQDTQKKDSRKSTGQKSLRKSKSKSKEVLAVAEAREPASSESMPLATKGPSESRDSSTERKKRTSRVTKQTKTVTPMTRACSHARSLAATPTPSTQRNPSNERQPLTMPPLVPLASKPQRQARKSLKQTKAEAQAQSRGQAECSEAAKVTQSRKRKPPAKSLAGGAKRLKEQPAMSETAVAFPVRITAAALTASRTSIAEPMATVERQAVRPLPPLVPIMPVKLVQKDKDLQLPPQPLPPKLRKLRVRLNRSVIPNWLKSLKQAEQAAQRLEPATAAAPPSATTATTSAAPKQAEPLISKSQPAARRPQVKIPIINSVPLPVPLPVLEVKPELPEMEEEPQSINSAAAAPALHLEIDVPVPSIAQVAASMSSSQTPTRVEPAAMAQPGMNMASSASNTISSHANTAIALAPAPAPTPAHAPAPANTSGTSSTTSSIPPANVISDQNTFGTTKMFSFLYPSRYQRSYSQVGLDFCCPNLDGPMQAIDPTRLHSKAEVPVLELPQYMVISTKIISRQDKNIPPKVRAKLEQLAAARDAATTSAIPTVLPAATAAVATPPVPAVASSAPPTMSHGETVAQQLPPQNTTLAKNPPPANATPPAANAAASPKILSSPPPLTAIRSAKKSLPSRGMLQLPPICPTDKMRTDLQSRVQLFDHVLQGLSRRAAVMSVLERKQVIENIVKTSALLPVDVEMAIKLLESYSYCLYAVNSANARNLEQRQQQQQSPAAASTSNSRAAGAAAAAPAGSPALTASSPLGASSSTPVYDASNKIIGYQYKTPNMSMKSSRGTFVKVTPSSTAAGSGASSPAAGAATQQRGRPSAASGKVASVNLVSPTVVPTRVAKRVGSGTMIPFNPSPAQKTYAGRSTAASARKAVGTADKAAPVGIVNGMPQLGAVPQAALAEDNINRTNLFIVNQLMSQQEECILPDAIGTVETAAADIKGELEDAETLT
ncbi:PREDICTED: nascent polypeptide-associated complex subunit alpha, muscle-specific form isoform X1 [Drosophila arizonae]|uniref:Nascent polypeptide-associated complex subunit alpha, muscle-specific form isoform X1 n=1 Tax=Drosophila arizonae TaxID=7263 RepID=A0ABM1PK61_DROAR|nr:PREDICTED: nascent polypeptide-associated complex subunit alpha, muscle-specific form isoform X1 [Drosophila arizonae]